MSITQNLRMLELPNRASQAESGASRFSVQLKGLYEFGCGVPEDNAEAATNTLD